VLLYLRLVGPAILASLAAASTLVVVAPTAPAGGGRDRAGRARLPRDRGLAAQPAAGPGRGVGLVVVVRALGPG
jgi:hypothetical protein